ncbi:hypothetical protein FACS1894111_10010 [Clostridia bacterium]|nr:hypothetical protein FACS1894111_10010 [Clostridia bacterium]
MKLFDVIPGNFFSILSSGNREIYFDALMILHEMFKFELNIRVDDYISSLISILEDRVFEVEADDEAQEGGLTTSGKARVILSRFTKTGWVDKEFLDGSFIEIITPRSYAIPVMKLLGELSDNALQEYNSLVFATFSGLKQAQDEDESHMYEALLSAKANTEQLQYSLRTLYHGIRGFLRGIVEQQDVNLLLQDHFGEYKKMSDRIYHPIKTMDSVHRYMAPIQKILSDLLANEEQLQNMRERAINIKKHSGEEIADEEIISAIDYILDTYQTVGSLVSEIDRKHSAYTKSSIEKIQYIMSADQTIKGKLADLLKNYASATEEKRDQIATVMESHINVNRQEFVDEKSLYHKNVKSRRIDRTPIAVEKDNSFADLAEGYLLEQIKNGYPKARVSAFIKGLFAEGIDSIHAKDIPITCDSDFILLILAVIRQNDRGMPYSIKMQEGRIAKNSYLIPNMVISYCPAEKR